MLRAATTRSLEPGARSFHHRGNGARLVRSRSRGYVSVRPEWSISLCANPFPDQPREVKPPRSSASRRMRPCGYLAFGMYIWCAYRPDGMSRRTPVADRSRECRRTARNRPSRPPGPGIAAQSTGISGRAIGRRRSPVARWVRCRRRPHREVAPSPHAGVQFASVGAEVRDQGVGDRLTATDRHRPADRVAEHCQHQPRARRDQGWHA